ncbi:MAG TPA: hypothetical protein VMG30_11670 [Acidobacteriota bacterium]|nr:hypothetical protein [Acidobacteriota bacterium]
MRRSMIVCLLALAGTVLAGVPEFEGRPAVVLSNGKIELTVTLSGASLANLRLLDDPTRLSPYWNPARAARLAGGDAQGAGNAGGVLGHFLCLDGFGAPSQEELKAGYPFHGEASSRHFEVIQSTKVGPVSSIFLATHLPLAQEFVTRTIRMVDDENVAYVETDVESLLSIDRPISWAEHATIGPPFLEPGEVTVDMPAGRCRVRAEKPGPVPGRLVPLQDFNWPMAPLRRGGSVSLLEFPGETSYDLASCQIDPKRTYGYVTAFHKDRHLLFGYVFRRQDFPWLMSWMNYSGNAQAARGIEFSTQPFDVSRRETLDAHEMFGAPTYKWLPAKSRMRTRFLLFYTKVPDNLTAVADVELEKGQLRIINKAGQTVALHARLPL